MQQPIIKIQNLTKLFSIKEKRGIRNISLNIKKGEILCVLGPSGSGKSTLLKIISQLEYKDSGKLILDPILNKQGNNIYVAQDYTLWPHLNVLENIILAPIKVKKYNRHTVIKEAKLLLNRFGLDDYMDAYPSQLSGGQKQRVALLRAIMMKPQMLLLDEVTSALDPELTKSVLDMIRSLSLDGYTMMVITHHVSLALSIADRIIFINNGKIIENSATQNFFYHQTNPQILSFINEIAKKDHTVEVFTGKDQFRTYHLSLLKRLPRGSTIYVAGSIGDRWYLPMGNSYNIYEQIRIKKKIKWKMLMYEIGKKDKKLFNDYPELNEFRTLPRTLKNPANYNVMENDTVIIQIFDKKPTIIEIKDAAVAKTYIAFFEEMWNNSLPLLK